MQAAKANLVLMIINFLGVVGIAYIWKVPAGSICSRSQSLYVLLRSRSIEKSERNIFSTKAFVKASRHSSS